MRGVSLLLLLVCAAGCATDSKPPRLDVREQSQRWVHDWRPPGLRATRKFYGQEGQFCFYGPCYAVSPDPEKFVRAYLISKYESIHRRDVKVEDISFETATDSMSPPKRTIQTILEVSLCGDRVVHLTVYELPFGDEIDSKSEGKSHLQTALESAAREIYELYGRRVPCR